MRTRKNAETTRKILSLPFDHETASFPIGKI